MNESSDRNPFKRRKEEPSLEKLKDTYTVTQLIDRKKGLWGDSFPRGGSKWVQVYMTSDGALMGPVIVKSPRFGKVPLFVELCSDKETGVKFALAHDNGIKREPKRVKFDGFGAEIRSISVMTIIRAESQGGTKDIVFLELTSPPEK